MEARVEDAEGGVVFARDCDNRAVGEDRRLRPYEHPVFRDAGRSNISTNVAERGPETFPWLRMNPPKCSVALSPELHAKRLDVFENVLERALIKGGFFLRQLGTEVNDPCVRRSPNDVHAIQPGEHDVRVRPTVRIRRLREP